jgi:hypothetical protein
MGTHPYISPLNRLVDVQTQLPKSIVQNHAKNGTDIHNLELHMNTHKVQQVKKLHGALIGLGQYDKEPNSAAESPVKGFVPGSSLSIFT